MNGARIGLAASVLAAAAAGAALGARSRRGERRPTTDRARERTPFSCQCGQALLVVGRDRHRVFWPAGADDGEPLLEPSCPSCGRALV